MKTSKGLLMSVFRTVHQPITAMPAPRTLVKHLITLQSRESSDCTFGTLTPLWFWPCTLQMPMYSILYAKMRNLSPNDRPRRVAIFFYVFGV